MHRYQKLILKELTFKPGLKFSQMAKTQPELTTEHFNYHLKELENSGYIEKVEKKYMLTEEGKKYVDYLDFQDKKLSVEKIPKLSVLIYIKRVKNNGEVEYLMSRRLKEPYYRKIGNMTGKVKFGESFYEAAERELKEETGLTADLVIRQIYHKVRKNKDEEAVQDVVFIIFMAKNPRGRLRQPLDGEAEFFWTSLEDLIGNEDLFDDINLTDPDERLGSELKVVESLGVSKGY